MAKAGRKVYAVRVGREGPQVYSTWEEVSPSISMAHNLIRDADIEIIDEAKRWHCTSLISSFAYAFVSRQVARFPGAIHKSFPASQMKEAEEWIKGAPSQQKPCK